MKGLHVSQELIHDLAVEVLLGRIRKAEPLDGEVVGELVGVQLVAAPYMMPNRAVLTVNGQVKAVLNLNPEDPDANP